MRNVAHCQRATNGPSLNICLNIYVFDFLHTAYFKNISQIRIEAYRQRATVKTSQSICLNRAKISIFWFRV